MWYKLIDSNGVLVASNDDDGVTNNSALTFTPFAGTTGTYFVVVNEHDNDEIGSYELHFSVGKYFAARGVPLSDPPFLDQIPLRFSVSEPEGHLHVPLLVTPWSYATYRGS